MRKTTLAAAVAAAFATSAHAVRLDPDGLGQALIFPYYTVQSVGGSGFNTYLSIVNHGGDEKALRVRFREGRSGREVAAFNLFLARNDTWVGAVVPFATGTRVIGNDASCTDPPFSPSLDGVPPPGDVPGITFSNAQYSGAQDDGGGAGLDRTREGWVEVLEMATLTATSALQATHNAAGIPANCGALRLDPTPTVAAPTGGLSGTLTVIEVTKGMDFTVKADALAELATTPYFRRANDPYPGFDASEIKPLSTVTVNGVAYRSEWTRASEAVSAALMRSEALGEFVLETPTRSQTDIVVTFPTRHLLDGTTPRAPFENGTGWSATCNASDPAPRGETMRLTTFDRAQRATEVGVPELGGPPLTPRRFCAGANVLPVGIATSSVDASNVVSLLGSTARGFSYGGIPVPAALTSGWVRIEAGSALNGGFVPKMTSLRSSTRLVLATGFYADGAHTYVGYPMVGFMVRSFQNGTLVCPSGACQGNYGGSFSLSFRRSVGPPP